MFPFWVYGAIAKKAQEEEEWDSSTSYTSYNSKSYSGGSYSQTESDFPWIGLGLVLGVIGLILNYIYLAIKAMLGWIANLLNINWWLNPMGGLPILQFIIIPVTSILIGIIIAHFAWKKYGN